MDLTGLWALDSHLPTLPLTTSPGFVFKNVFFCFKLIMVLVVQRVTCHLSLQQHRLIFFKKKFSFAFCCHILTINQNLKQKGQKRSLSRRSVEVEAFVCLSLPKYKFVAHLEICGFECYHCLIAWIFQSMESAILVYALGFPNLAILAISQSGINWNQFHCRAFPSSFALAPKSWQLGL